MSLLSKAEILQTLAEKLELLKQQIDCTHLFESQAFFALHDYIEESCISLEMFQKTIKSHIGGMFAIAKEQLSHKKSRPRMHQRIKQAFLPA